MATYTIVSDDKTPLGPGEINAGETIDVAEGDVFIIDPTANKDIVFESASGSATDFDIVYSESNAESLKISIESDLTVNMSVADGVDISGFEINASSSDGVNLTAGNGMSMGKLQSSNGGADAIDLGDNFTATDDWDLHDGDDVMTVGDDATFINIKLGNGDDSLTFGDRATIHDIDGEGGNDTFTFDDDLIGNKIKGGAGDDVFNVGHRASVTEFAGEGDADTYNTSSPSQTANGMETTNVVCFATGTPIATEVGESPVERLRPGDRVMTLDNGPKPLRWISSVVVAAEQLAHMPQLAPIRIAASALGSGVPARDLRVSPQHRLLVRSRIAQRMFGTSEILLPAGKLLDLPGIGREAVSGPVTYVHFVFDQQEIVWANGAPAESLLIGSQGVAHSHFRSPRGTARAGALALVRRTRLPCPPDTGRRIRRLITRHIENAKPVYAA